MDEGLSASSLEQIRRSVVMSGTVPKDVALELLAEVHRLRSQLAGDARRRHPAAGPDG